jgi:plasmid maintenance system antidote protein VapI
MTRRTGGEKVKATATVAADVRAAIARARYPIYKLGALASIHPTKLSRMINEKRPLPPEVAERLLRILDEQGRRTKAPAPAA